VNLTGGEDAREFRGVTGCRSVARFSAFHSKPLVTRIFQTLRPEQGQSFAVQIEVDQREACAQPVVVLLQAPVSHLVKSKHPPGVPGDIDISSAPSSFQDSSSRFERRVAVQTGFYIGTTIDLPENLQQPSNRPCEFAWSLKMKAADV